MDRFAGMPLEALIFLGVIAGLLTMVIIFFLYLNKMFCFSECGGFPCIEKKPRRDPEKKRILGTAYSPDDQESSSDSEDEAIYDHYQASRRASMARASLNSGNGAIKVLSTHREDGEQDEDEETSQLLPDTAATVHEADTLPDAFTGQTNGGFEDDEEKDDFDISDLEGHEGIPVSKYGCVYVSLDYLALKNRMVVTVHQVKDVPSKENGGADHTQIRMLLLPSKKIKHKTKIRPGKNPEFQETFEFKVPVKDAGSMSVRFRLYGCERMRQERVIGETLLEFGSLSLQEKISMWLPLEPQGSLGHGDSKLDVSSVSPSGRGSPSGTHSGVAELLCGLTYNRTTGRLAVEIIKGSNFKHTGSSRPADSLVKLTLMSAQGQEIMKAKTSVRRSQPNPIFKESFMFQVALFQLQDVTVMISVYHKRAMKRNEMLGWFSLGYSSSGEEEAAHWNAMRDSQGEPVARWHALSEP